MTPADPEPHWRDGERLIAWVESVCRVPKVWQSLRAIRPSSAYLEAWEAQVHFLEQPPRLQKYEPLWLRAHQEQSGVMIMTLTVDGGKQVLRRGHIGGEHQEADGGPFLNGPHVHYPTSIYGEIGNRGRSRAYMWSIDPDVSLREAVLCFADEMRIGGLTDEQALLLGGS